MGRIWNAELRRRYFTYRGTAKAWELLHEEEGFEDIGMDADDMISDLDGQETHIHFREEGPYRAVHNK